MILLEFLVEVIFEGTITFLPRWIGMGTKWLFYLGQKPMAIIKKENWNSSIGFIVLFSMILIIIYLAN